MKKKDIVTENTISKPLYEKMLKFQHQSGYGIQETICFLLDYIVGFLDYTGTPVDGWRFKGDDNIIFQDLTFELFKCVADGIEKFEWYDIFGDIFMKYVGNKDALGQCFTPKGIADTLSRIQNYSVSEEELQQSKMRCRSFGMRPTTNDPTCGSGRLLLASCHYIHEKFGEYAYAIAEDIDANCCKQTAINLALHGFYGEVVCHNTILEPDTVRMGYIVNEGLYPSREGLPTIRRSTNPEDFLVTLHWKQMKGEL